MSSAFCRVARTSLARRPNCSPALRISLATPPPLPVPGIGIPNTSRLRLRRPTKAPAAAPRAAVATGKTRFFAALATPLVPPVVAPSARSASMSSREPVRRERDAAGRERDARRVCGGGATDDRADERAFRLLEAGGRPELAFPRPPLLLTDGARPDNPELERLEAARLS